MAKKNFLKKGLYWPIFFLCVFCIVSVSVSLGYQLAGTIYSRYSGIIGSMDLSGAPRLVPSEARPETVRFPALPGAGSEVTASWYGPKHHEKLTASGQRFDMYKNTLAHRTLPLGTKVRLINLDNGRSAEGIVNDRGPYIKGRDVDVSYAIAKQLGFSRKGIIKLILEPIWAIGEMNRED